MKRLNTYRLWDNVNTVILEVKERHYKWWISMKNKLVQEKCCENDIS